MRFARRYSTGFDWSRWVTGTPAQKLSLLPAAQEHILKQDEGGHGLMQAIARVNRVFKDKPGGLVVDYLGLADELRRALATYRLIRHVTELSQAFALAVPNDEALRIRDDVGFFQGERAAKTDLAPIPRPRNACAPVKPNCLICVASAGSRSVKHLAQTFFLPGRLGASNADAGLPVFCDALVNDLAQ
jgi:hypothetical protein